MMHLIKRIISHAFMRYLLIGATATLVDWSIYSLGVYVLGIHYLIAVILSYSTAVIIHYSLNRIFTFRSTTKKIAAQFSMHVFVTIISLCGSILLLGAFVDGMGVEKFIGRVLTTGVMFFINYLLHRQLTFNKKFFK